MLPLISAGIFTAKAAPGMYAAWDSHEQVKREADLAKKAAQNLRLDSQKDHMFAQVNLDNESQGVRMQATASAHQSDLNQLQLQDQAAEEQGGAMVGQLLRGVSGSGTSRSLLRGFGQFGRAQVGIGLERTAAFNRYNLGMKSVNLQRRIAGENLNRAGRKANTIEDEANYALGRSQTERNINMAGTIANTYASMISTGLSMGMGAPLGLDAGEGMQGAGMGSNNRKPLSQINQSPSRVNYPQRNTLAPNGYSWGQTQNAMNQPGGLRFSVM